MRRLINHVLKKNFNNKLKELKTVNDLEKKLIIMNETIGRKDFKVLVIDDEGFDVTPIKSLGYKQFEVKYSFEEIEMYKKYDVILCDIRGVGGHIDPDRQGLAVAIEIKKQFSEKLVLIYSSASKSDFLENDFKKVDGIIEKGISTQRLSQRLDKEIQEFFNYTRVWKEQRDKMLEQEIDLKVLCVLEDKYCKILENKRGIEEELKKSLDFSSVDFNKIESHINLLVSFAKIIVNVGGVNG
ncbi:MAG: hypothetical protein RSA05_00325 [Cetobacterium sp.]|uniref:hypothetical protein n=1 Tax=Cetobacterium sp. TaxID=2071632 RepID=UPI002FC71C08